MAGQRERENRTLAKWDLVTVLNTQAFVGILVITNERSYIMVSGTYQSSE